MERKKKPREINKMVGLKPQLNPKTNYIDVD